MTAEIIPFPTRARRSFADDLDIILDCEDAGPWIDELLACADVIYGLMLAGWLKEAAECIDDLHDKRNLASNCPHDVRAAMQNMRDDIVGDLRADLDSWLVSRALPSEPGGAA